MFLVYPLYFEHASEFSYTILCSETLVKQAYPGDLGVRHETQRFSGNPVYSGFLGERKGRCHSNQARLEHFVQDFTVGAIRSPIQ